MINLFFLSPIPYHDTLTHLGPICMKIIVYLFKCVPRICNLKLKAHRNCHHELADPMFWETFLSKYLVKLKRLSLDVYTSEKNSSKNSIWKYLTDKEKVNQQIEKFNYWSSHSLKTKFDSGVPTAYTPYFAKFLVL